MNHSENIDKIIPALVKAQAEIEPAKKDKVNPHFKSKYANHEAVVEASHEILAKYGLAISQGSLLLNDREWALETVLFHESGQWVSFLHPAEPVKKDPQNYASANSYARRYGHMGIIGMATTEDDDGNAASGVGVKQKQAQNTVRQDQNTIPQTQTSNINMPINGTMLNNLVAACKKNDMPWQKVMTFTKKEYNKEPTKLNVVEYETVIKLINTGAL